MSEYPLDWTISNLGAYLAETKERAGDSNAIPYSVSKVLGIVPQSEKFNKRVASSDISNYKVIRKGDFAYDPMLLWDGSINRMLREGKGAVSPAYVTFRVTSNSLDADYLLHLLKASTTKNFYKSISKGTNVRRQKAEFGDFAGGEFAFPPLPEQKKIAEILSGIDQEIIRIQKQITSLELLRTAILEQSLEQLKDCPIYPLHEITKKVTVGIVSKPADHYVSKGVPTLRSMNIKEGKIDYKDLRFISEDSNQFFKKSIIREGDILTVRTGVPGTSAVAPADIDGANCVDIIISTPAEGVDSHFLCLQINSDRIKSKVLSGQGGLAQQHFNIGEMRVLDILLPSLDAQKEISSAVLSASQCIASRCKQRSKYEGVKSAVADELLSGRKRVSV